ncbi:MAG: ABC transporter permease [Caldilineae bacterium]|nr:ABC transporter permease [Anaerolineae bacterium]MCB9154633.1 ABC transporter permease [Caldilineae bacterium]
MDGYTAGGGGSDPASLFSEERRRGLAAAFSRVGRALRELYARPASALGTTLVLVFFFMALFGPLIAPYSATEQIAGAARQAPSLQHLFGTDHLGRDVFSRVVLGARDILALAGLGTLLAVTIGTLVGMFSAYRGGWVDEISFRLFDSLLALPALLLALLLLGVVGPSRSSVLVVLVIVYVPIVARVVRSVVLSTKQKGFVEAARMQGESTASIVRRDIFPSVTPALTVEAALRFSYAIFLVASLGFLGVGVQPPNPDWGLMVSQARPYVSLTPWALYFPAIAIALLVIGVNLAADGLKRVLLPGRES